MDQGGEAEHAEDAVHLPVQSQPATISRFKNNGSFTRLPLDILETGRREEREGKVPSPVECRRQRHGLAANVQGNDLSRIKPDDSISSGVG